MTREEAEMIIGNVIKVFGLKISEEQADAWVWIISDLPRNRTRNECNRMLVSGTGFPGAATLRRNVLRGMGVLSPDLETAVRQGKAYSRYLEQLQYVNGSGYQPTCSIPLSELHPAVARTVRATGGAEWDERGFRFTYKQIAAETDDELVTNRLDRREVAA